jgi:putative endopeptidase
MKKHYCLLYAAVIAMTFVACAPKEQGTPPTTETVDALAAHIDSTVKPGDDFFLYANGKWFKENPIKPSERTAGLWRMIQDTIAAQVLDICEKSAEAKAEKGTSKQKIGDFYLAGMDSVALNAQGITGIAPELAKIDAIANLDDLARALARLHEMGSGSIFSFFVTQDDRNSAKYAIYIYQGGLSLPDREYYIDPQLDSIRTAFVDFSSKMFGIMGYDAAQAQAAAKQNLALETAIAKASRKIEDTRDPDKNYNKWTFSELTSKMPKFNWTLFNETAGLVGVDSVVVGQPEFLVAVNGLLQSASLDDWKNYLKLQLLSTYAEYLDDKTFQESFAFYSTALNGVKQAKPRWKRVVARIDDALGELVGQVYVAEYLPKGTKEKLLEIGNAIKDVYADRIQQLDWMSAETKQKALEKLDGIVMKVGYPDKWKDLSSMEINRGSYVESNISAARWQYHDMIRKYGKPVDRTEWNMQPQYYNAYYNPSNNEIVVPGCNIMVPGYEGKLADDAILYSIIGGSTFGHEITHGFDDQGSKYDKYGNLSDWWTKEDKEKFTAKTRMIVAQFNAYVAVDTLHINGEMTQGENIADLGGIIMGYEAFKRTEQYKSGQKIAGLTPDQRFFLGYALAWMINERPESIANKVRSDVHSPAKFRVIGPLTNMPEFYAAFGIQPGEAMWRPDSLRVNIW